MSGRIQFDENQYSLPRKELKPRNGMVDLLVQNGVVKDPAQAMTILSAVIVICMIATGIITLLSMKNNTVYVVEPPIEEQSANFQ